MYSFLCVFLHARLICTILHADKVKNLLLWHIMPWQNITTGFISICLLIAVSWSSKCKCTNALGLQLAQHLTFKIKLWTRERNAAIRQSEWVKWACSSDHHQMSQYHKQVFFVAENMTPRIQNCSNCSQALIMELNITKAIVLSFVLSIFVIFGVLGNILVILSVACHRSLRTVTHYFIVNLAVADLLLSSTVLPFSAIFEMLGHWVFGRAFCDVWAAMDVLCCTASIMSLCVISVDRYIGVSYPLRYPAIVTEKRALLALMGIWALSITISIGPLFGWKEPAPENEYVCKITEEPGYAIFSAVGSFYLPLVVILVMYCRVYVVARRETYSLRKGHKTEKAHHAEAVTLRIHRGNTAVVEEETLRSRTHFTIRLLKFTREKKAAKTLGIVVGCFVLCWLPFFLVLPIGECQVFLHWSNMLKI